MAGTVATIHPLLSRSSNTVYVRAMWRIVVAFVFKDSFKAIREEIARCSYALRANVQWLWRYEPLKRYPVESLKNISSFFTFVKDLDAEYGTVCTAVSPDDPHVYTAATVLDWAHKRRFPVRRDAGRLSVLWLERSAPGSPIEYLHSVPGTMHVLPGSTFTLVTAYAYPDCKPVQRYYRLCFSGMDLEHVLTTLFDEAAWPVRH